MPVDVEFSIWLASKSRWVHLVKFIPMNAVPRVGEFIKFKNSDQGEYFSFTVSEVTYRESGNIEVWTELFQNIDNRGYSFDDEAEFDEYYNSYLSEGWVSERGIGPNRHYKGPKGQDIPIQ